MLAGAPATALLAGPASRCALERDSVELLRSALSVAYPDALYGQGRARTAPAVMAA